MNWMPALNPWQWGLLAVVPLGIVLLYFLKLRRQPVQVPSTYLWKQTVEDLHVNSLIQRLRRSILLLLQLLAVALAALALLRPGALGTTAVDARYVFLLDSSASMNATDVTEGTTRFEIAKNKIADRIATLSDSDVAMLITFNDRAEVLQSFTADRRRLRDALGRAKPTNRPTDILAALQAADGLANPKRSSESGTNDYQVADAMPAELLIFSDGNFQTPTLLEIGPTQTISADSVETWLRDVGYVAASDVRRRGDFKRAGKTITVFSPMESNPTEIQFDGSGRVKSIREIIGGSLQSGGALRSTAAEPAGVAAVTFEPRLSVKLGALQAQSDRLDDFSLGNLTPEYIPIGRADVDNLAITTFSAQRNPKKPAEVQAFATVTNFGTRRRSANAVLTVGGILQEASSVDLKRGEKVGLSFVLSLEDAVSLEFALEEADRGGPLRDDLATDNVAYAGLSPLKMVSILVITPGNRALEVGLSTEKNRQICTTDFLPPSYLETEAYADRADAAVDDLIIYDRCSPPRPPATHTFSIGALPDDRWRFDSDPGSIVPLDVNRTHPLMRFVELYALLIFEGRSIVGPEGTVELASGDTGTFLAIAPRDGLQDLVLGFPIVSTDADGNSQTNTNWFAERSWPVFLFNVARFLAGAAEETGAPSYRPGSTVQFRLENAITGVEMQRNAKPPADVSPDASGRVEIVATEQTGNYRFTSGEQLVHQFAVNLFDPAESKIAVSPAVEIGYETVEGAAAGVEGRREYWRWLLLAVLIVLAAEWYYFNRRVA